MMARAFCALLAFKMLWDVVNHVACQSLWDPRTFSTLAFGMYDGLDNVHHRVTLSRSHFLLAGPLNPKPYRWILVVYCSLPGLGLRSGCRRCVPRYVAAGRGASNNTMGLA